MWQLCRGLQKAINTSYYGQNPAGKVYKEVMNRIHDGLEYKGFEMGDEVVRRTYCTATGLLANADCSGATGWYKVDHLPRVCSGCSGESTPSGGNQGGQPGEDVTDPNYEIPEF